MTTEAKHTPGPWLVREGFDPENFEVYPQGDGPPTFGQWAELAVVAGDYGSGEEAEGEANARLIAAAPDLFEAVRDAHSMLSNVEVVDGEDGDPWSKALARMSAALAKATGQ